MAFKIRPNLGAGGQAMVLTLAIALPVLLQACGTGSPSLSVKMVVGSALQEFCQQAAEKLNQTNPKLASGETFGLSCEAAGSGDAVDRVVRLAEQAKSGAIAQDDPQLPTLVSLDGDIYQEQLVRRMGQVFPGQQYVPGVTDAPLLANSPMVFMAPEELAPSVGKTKTLFKALVSATTHKDLDPSAPAQKIHYVHTAPTRSNSGLQTLVAQFAEVSGKRPEALSVADVTQFQGQVGQIQQKITRYGVSTSSLAESMVKNGPFWASIGSVYEASVIAVNSNRATGQPLYKAVYPPATFTSNMRGILMNAPWVSPQEKEAGEKILAYLQSPEAQQLAANLGLRPGNPSVPLGPKFTPEFGVDPKATYDSYRSPQPEVVDAMLKTWEQTAKKPSRVVLVVDSSGSMEGEKMASVQNTIKTYIETLGPKDDVALLDFDSQVRAPIQADSTPAGRDRGLQFVSSLQVDGGTSLYDAVLAGQNWLAQNLKPNAINAVLVLTDGEDSGSTVPLNQLQQTLKNSGFSSDKRIGVFTVGYGQAGEFNPDVLKQIAEANGGYYAEGKPETIAQVMSNLQLEF